MEEKIKIYIPESVNNILLKDMERFEILKKDGSLNKNEFYNTLIVNYFESFQNDQRAFFDFILNTVEENADIHEYVTNDIAHKILQYAENRNNQLSEQRLDVTISLKPTKRSSDTIDQINYGLNGFSLSGYIRNMFASYTLLPQDKREKIIFKDNFAQLENAITNNKMVYFTTIKNRKPHIASPYAICNSKEELFNYLLAEYNGYPYSFRISRLKKVIVRNEPAEHLKRNVDIFERMKKHGPQFAYQIDEDMSGIRVRLTEKGKQMYKNMYLHRPQYTVIEDDDYIFECSQTQAFQYFCRFGEDARILSPEELIDKMKDYYAKACETYQ